MALKRGKRQKVDHTLEKWFDAAIGCKDGEGFHVWLRNDTCARCNISKASWRVATAMAGEVNLHHA